MHKKLHGGAITKHQKLMYELHRQADARKVHVCDLAEMSGLYRGAITKWINQNVKPRRSSWNKVQHTLETLPIKYPELLVEPSVLSRGSGNGPTPGSPVFDDEPVKRPPIQTEAEREAQVMQVVAKQLANLKPHPGSPEHMAMMRERRAAKMAEDKALHETRLQVANQQGSAKAKDIIIDLIVEQLRTMDIAQVALVLGNVMGEKS